MKELAGIGCWVLVTMTSNDVHLKEKA